VCDRPPLTLTFLSFYRSARTDASANWVNSAFPPAVVPEEQSRRAKTGPPPGLTGEVASEVWRAFRVPALTPGNAAARVVRPGRRWAEDRGSQFLPFGFVMSVSPPPPGALPLPGDGGADWISKLAWLVPSGGTSKVTVDSVLY
jgi:hypothetical protein